LPAVIRAIDTVSCPVYSAHFCVWTSGRASIGQSVTMLFNPDNPEALERHRIRVPVDRSQVLVVRAANRVCVLPVTETLETMRPLPSGPIAGMPPFVLGISIIRGGPVPVVDLAMLLSGKAGTNVTRFVVLRSADRRVALAVESVIGIRYLDTEVLGAFPFQTNGQTCEAIQAIGALDGELLIALDTKHLVPGELWKSS
jgi:purine-binding chemotaxis protein CheW